MVDFNIKIFRSWNDDVDDYFPHTTYAKIRLYIYEKFLLRTNILKKLSNYIHKNNRYKSHKYSMAISSQISVVLNQSNNFLCWEWVL